MTSCRQPWSPVPASLVGKMSAVLPIRKAFGRTPKTEIAICRQEVVPPAGIEPATPGLGNMRKTWSPVGPRVRLCCTVQGCGKRSVPPSPRSAEQRDGVAADLGGEHVAEVGKEGAALQAAGDRGREQPRDGALALLGLAAQRQLAVDHRAAQAALGVVVGRLDAGHAREAPEGRPALQEVLGEAAVAAITGALSRRHRSFAKNLLKRWPALWSFASVPGVEPTNNHAERGLRGAVIYRKLSLGSQSEEGERTIARLLSASVTCRLQRRSLFAYLSDVLAAKIRGDPIPLLS